MNIYKFLTHQIMAMAWQNLQSWFMESVEIITHGASEASGVRNFWHLSAKILYTVEPKQPLLHVSILRLRLHLRKKNITSPCIHFVSLWNCGDNRSKYLGDNLSASFGWTTDNFQALLKGIFAWVCFFTFCWQT